jgi:Arc/MetJ-type ribon-helix-helix transcriptional regulator
LSLAGRVPVRLKNALDKPPTNLMVDVDINVPEHLDMRIAQLIDDGEFVDRNEAVEELLSTGIKAYKTAGPQSEMDTDTEFEDDMMGHEDEYVF